MKKSTTSWHGLAARLLVVEEQVNIFIKFTNQTKLIELKTVEETNQYATYIIRSDSCS
jgi:hypothetical protein